MNNTRWETYNPLKPANIPAVPGCYVLVLNRRFVYVGSTENLRARIQSYSIQEAMHDPVIMTPWGTCVRISCKAKPSKKYGDWAMIELRLIKRLQPVLNRRGSIGRAPWDHRKNGSPLVRNSTGIGQLMATVEQYISGVKLERYNIDSGFLEVAR